LPSILFYINTTVFVIIILIDDGLEQTTTQVEIYPFNTSNIYIQDSTSYDIAAYIKYSYNKLVTWTQSDLGSVKKPQVVIDVPLILTWINSMDSVANFNRSLADRSVTTGFGRTAVSYDVKNTAPTAPSCYASSATSLDGFFLSDTARGSTSTCTYPKGIYFCEYGLCGEYTGGVFSPLVDNSATSSGARMSFTSDSNVEAHTEEALSDVTVYGAMLSADHIQQTMKDLARHSPEHDLITGVTSTLTVSVAPSYQLSKRTVTYDENTISDLLAANPEAQSITSKILKRIHAAQSLVKGGESSLMSSHSRSIGRNSKSAYSSINSN
jgi:hypothetical protein